MNKVRSTKKLGLKLLPPDPNLCQECAVRHRVNEPHNKDSLYYQIHFKMKRGRSPNLEDAMSHCSENMKQLWREKLARLEKKQIKKGENKK